MIQKLALHGFLGLPSDWNHWEGLTPCAIDTAPDLWTWASHFNRWVKAHISAPRILIGYSMGGRLALHALIDQPALWTQGILISTHPGLKHSEERERRLAHDLNWAEKFQKMPWEDLMEVWESQPIFQTAAYRPKREETLYSREKLAQQLENFSLGKQENLIPYIRKIPLQWITGEKDATYGALAKESLNDHSSHISIPDGSHRVHLEFPEIVKHLFFVWVSLLCQLI